VRSKTDTRIRIERGADFFGPLANSRLPVFQLFVQIGVFGWNLCFGDSRNVLLAEVTSSDNAAVATV
jgi:hypothetical protein